MDPKFHSVVRRPSYPNDCQIICNYGAQDKRPNALFSAIKQDGLRSAGLLRFLRSIGKFLGAKRN